MDFAHCWHTTGSLQGVCKHTGEGRRTEGFKACLNVPESNPVGPTLAGGSGPCGAFPPPGSPSAHWQLFHALSLQVLSLTFSGSRKTFLEKPQGTNFFCAPGQQTVVVLSATELQPLGA